MGIVFMVVNGAGFLAMLPSLGTVPQEGSGTRSIRSIHTQRETSRC